ncbi:MAG: hypothetical protein V5A43_01490, partial [Haloarculaceae archaeon]
GPEEAVEGGPEEAVEGGPEEAVEGGPGASGQSGQRESVEGGPTAVDQADSETGEETPGGEGAAGSGSEDGPATANADVSQEAEDLGGQNGEEDGEEDGGEDGEEDGGEDGGDAGGDVPEDADLEDVAVEVMSKLDEGSGASRRAVVETTMERTGADEAAVEDAIQSALMDGRCYEPADDSLQAI